MLHNRITRKAQTEPKRLHVQAKGKSGASALMEPSDAGISRVTPARVDGTAYEVQSADDVRRRDADQEHHAQQRVLGTKVPQRDYATKQRRR